METKELRRGNLIINQWGEEGVVEQIGYTLVQFDNGYFTEENIKPIPLDEEWLYKLGFELDNGFTTYRIKVFKGYLIVALDGSWGLYKDEYSNRIGSSYNNKNEIKYVHQLQNFYNALTGEELSLNK